MTHRPAFMAITSTGGYIGRIFWNNSGIHPDFPRWGRPTIQEDYDRG